GNAMFQEMHVDGAVTSNVLAVPEAVLLQKVAFTNNTKPKTLHYRQRKGYARLCRHRRRYGLDRCSLVLLNCQGEYAKHSDCDVRLCAHQRLAIPPCCHSTQLYDDLDNLQFRYCLYARVVRSRPLDGPHGTAMANVAEGPRCKPGIGRF